MESKYSFHFPVQRQQLVRPVGSVICCGFHFVMSKITPPIATSSQEVRAFRSLHSATEFQLA